MAQPPQHLLCMKKLDLACGLVFTSRCRTDAHYFAEVLTMKKHCILLATALLLTLTVNSRAETPPVTTTAQSLYLQAGKQERQGETAKARETYELIIDRFPDSDFAVKANDRLLILPGLPAPPPVPAPVAAPIPSPASAPAATPATSPVKPAIGIDALLAPAELKPLPTDPLKRRAVELARQLQKAQIIRREEISQRQRTFTTQYGRRYNRATLADEQVRWEIEAEQKVRSEIGRSQGEIEQELATVCGQLGLPPKCSEDEITR